MTLFTLFTFCTENTLHKLLCKSIERVATEDKNKIFYELDCSNCESIFFSKSKVFKIAIR